MKKKELKNWKKYELVRREGLYNMITEFQHASKDAKLSIKDYSNIVKRYSLIKDYIIKEYNSVDDFLKLNEKDYKEK